jgi:phosphoribulokinase
MSTRHPIVAVTGSSGAGTTTIRHAFEDIFVREGIYGLFVDGDSFRRYDRKDMKEVVKTSIARGAPISHFGPEANLFERLEALFRSYSETGTGETRRYLQDTEEAELSGQEGGTFTDWAPVPPDADLLFYEGLHGGVVIGEPPEVADPCAPAFSVKPGPAGRTGHASVDVARWVDLLLGVVPIVNLEWIQKIHRDAHEKGATPEAVTATILRRMHDYIDFIVPQFSRSHINFQRVPLVDTSNPFIARDIPTADESVVVIRFRDPRNHEFPHYLRRIQGSYMSRANTLVAPGGKMGLAIEVICTPLIHRMLEAKRAAPA